MSISGSDGDTLGRVRDLASIPINNLSQIATKLIILPIAAALFGVVDVVNAGVSFLTSPLEAFASGLADLAGAILNAPATIIQAGGEASAGGVEVFGIIAFPVALGIVLAGATLYAFVLTEDETSNFLPFSQTDLPFIGADEEED